MDQRAQARMAKAALEVAQVPEVVFLFVCFCFIRTGQLLLLGLREEGPTKASWLRTCGQPSGGERRPLAA